MEAECGQDSLKIHGVVHVVAYVEHEGFPAFVCPRGGLVIVTERCLGGLSEAVRAYRGTPSLISPIKPLRGASEAPLSQ